MLLQVRFVWLSSLLSLVFFSGKCFAFFVSYYETFFELHVINQCQCNDMLISIFISLVNIFKQIRCYLDAHFIDVV